MGSRTWTFRGWETWSAIVAAVVVLVAQALLVAAAPARAADLVPREIAITDDEAGRQAARAIDKDGEDDRSVQNAVFVARDVETARAIYLEQVGLNDEIPEADRRVGQKLELKDANEIGEEGAGISACERSCNAGGEIYVHKRLVSRMANVVSVVYLWGLSHEEGTSDWHTRYFGDLVMSRARGAATGPAI